MAETLNLRYRMVLPLDCGYGNVGPNGTWTGMVGELAYGRADVALTWLHNRPDRASVIDYIYVTVDNNNDAFHVLGGADENPQVGLQMMNSLLTPMHANAWWALLVSLFVISAALRITWRFCHTYSEDDTVNVMTFGSCLLYTYMSLVGQGWDVVPNSLSARIVTIFSWVLSIIWITSYTANLISDLTVVSVDRPIKSLREFSEHPGWHLAMQPGYGVVNDWQFSPDEYERDLYRRTVHQEGIVSLDGPSSFRLSLHPKVMTYIDVRILLFSLGADACPLVQLRDLPPKATPNYMAIGKGQPALKRLMFATMTRMAESGLIKRLKLKWFDRINTLCTTKTDIKPMSISNVIASVMVLPLGIAISLFVSVLECIWRWRTAKRSTTHMAGN